MKIITKNGFIEKEWNRGECFPDEVDGVVAEITAEEFNTHNDVGCDLFGVLDTFEEKIMNHMIHNSEIPSDTWIIESITLRKYNDVECLKDGDGNDAFPEVEKNCFGARYVPVSNSKCDRGEGLIR